MKWPPTNFKESLAPIMFVNRLLGLRSFDCLSGKFKRMISLIYNFLIIAIVIASTKFEFKLVHDTKLLPLELLMYRVLTELNGVVICFSLIAGWYFTELFDKFIDRVMKIDGTLKLLGIPPDHRRTSYDCFKSIFNASTFLVLIVTVNIIWMSSQYTSVELILMAITCFLTFGTTEIMSLDFNVCIKAINRRFKAVNDLLISLPAMADISRNPSEENSTHMIEKLNAWLVLTVKTRTSDGELKRAIYSIKQVHLELVRASVMLCHVFRMQMTVEMGLATVLLTAIVYYMYVRFTLGEADISSLTQMSSSVLWCIAYCIRVILVNSSCEATIIEANRTSTAIHALHGMQIDTELKEEIHQFALQIMLRPLKFSIFGFSLSYAFIRSCFGAVTTYSLIMVQMSNDLAAVLNYGILAEKAKVSSGVA